MNRILVALDVSSGRDALALVDTLQGVVGGYKIGSQLFTSEGPSIVRALVDRGERVFLDLKFHDIPNTVAGAVAAATDLGVWMVNVHAAGGPPMLVAAKQSAHDTAARRGATPPLVIAVTVLTSMDDATLREIGVEHSALSQVQRLAQMTEAAGLDGVVASPQEVAAIRQVCSPTFVVVTPGIRGGTAVSGPDDQRRTATPAGAVAAGSSFLVIGRPITAAADPRSAAQRMAEEIATSR